MDPNETLDRIRDICTYIRETVGEDDNDTIENILDHADELSELVTALDQWLCFGGFLPAGWAAEQARKAGAK